MLEESQCFEELFILRFENVEEAIKFAKEIQPRTLVWKDIRFENKDNEPWICVLAICDICNHKSIFFAPAEIYNEEIIGSECSECGNKSVYPEEGSFEDA